jgi:hypothetical protein
MRRAASRTDQLEGDKGAREQQVTATIFPSELVDDVDEEAARPVRRWRVYVWRKEGA